ncbi:hypothetical protein LJC55_02325 [Eubacteriales bacterium OttesenSCG-928-N14]|nr:hypothetical protein [Eubacteriales bacterium OttesenSCG-928-N14]
MKTRAWVVAVAMLLAVSMIVACGESEKEPEFVGKFVNPDDPEDWVEFKAGGKFTVSSAGITAEGEFTMDGNEITAKATIGSEEMEYSYGLSDDGETLHDLSSMQIDYKKE